MPFYKRLNLSEFLSQISPHPFANDFKAWESNDGNSSQHTPDSFFAFSKPHHFTKAKQLCASTSLLHELQISDLNCEDISFLSGDPDLSKHAFVTRYGGHQFGQWADQLGDGRAHTLGRLGDWDVQVKGSGPNPYSRRGDGFAVLRSSLREFLMSEYMHHLGVPTTRALNLMTSGEQVLRDMFYDGNAAYEDGALVTRMAPSFIRFGHFQIFAAYNESANLKKLTEWTVQNYFPNHSHSTDDDIFEWFDHICQESLALVVHWMRVGFVHGVLNTDNMSIHGLTIDYGPFSMLDEYDRTFTPNTTDLPGRRYAFENQPAVFLWNLERLAAALSQITKNDEGFKTSLLKFKDTFKLKFEEMFNQKLGLTKELSSSEFIIKTDSLLQRFKFDYTLFFSRLSSDFSIDDILETSYSSLSSEDKIEVTNFVEEYKSKLSTLSDEKRTELRLMQLKTNPKFNLRNYMFVEILEDLQRGDHKRLNDVIKALENPYKVIKDQEHLYSKRPSWAEGRAGCTKLSCSS